MTSVLIELDKSENTATLIKVAPYAEMTAILTHYHTLYQQFNALGIHAKPYVLDLSSMSYSDDEQALMTCFMLNRSVNPTTYNMAIALSNNNLLAVRQYLNKMANMEREHQRINH